jgi:sirohydrochlorin cobaltochelatase
VTAGVADPGRDASDHPRHPHPDLEPQPDPEPRALLVVGHGTRSERGADAFRAFIGRVRARSALAGAPATPGMPPAVDGGFIELADPPVGDAVGRLVRAGHTRLAVVPLTLVSAGHAKGDIPGSMARERLRHPGLGYVYGRPLGPHPVLLELLAARLEAVCPRSEWSRTHVLLVGRGSTDPDANAEIFKVARLLWEGRGIGGVEAAFVSLAEPGVPAGLDRCRRLGARRIVVLPYFLFDGVLPDRVGAQARDWAAGRTPAPEPWGVDGDGGVAMDMAVNDAGGLDGGVDGGIGGGADVRCAGLIGDCDELADLVLERYSEACDGDIRMNCDTCLYRVALPGHSHRVGAPQLPHDHPHDPSDRHEPHRHEPSDRHEPHRLDAPVEVPLDAPPHGSNHRRDPPGRLPTARF